MIYLRLSLSCCKHSVPSSPTKALCQRGPTTPERLCFHFQALSVCVALRMLPLTRGLSSSVLLGAPVWADFPVIFLLLISRVISLWPENTCWVIPTLSIC